MKRPLSIASNHSYLAARKQPTFKRPPRESRLGILLAAAFLASIAPALADNAKAPQATTHVAAPPEPRGANAHELPRPDLKVSLSPDSPGYWPGTFTVTNVGVSRSEPQHLRIRVFVVGQDPLTKRSCIPQYTARDTGFPSSGPGSSASFLSAPATSSPRT